MNRFSIFISFCLSILFLFPLSAQHDFFHHHHFTKADTLRGMLRAERTCYDVTFYDLNIKINPTEESIKGYVDIFYDSKEDFERLQIDLFENMEIDKIVFKEKELKYKRSYNAIFIDFPFQKKGDKGSFRVHYHGEPTKAKNAPWDGGFVWKKDRNNDPWIGVACEGDGASLWWPNKDHLSDEPDSMSIRVAVPSDLMCVANGNLRKKTPRKDGYTQYDWFVTYPINNYNVSVNIAKYEHISDTYTALDGDTLALDYYVLSYNALRAKRHFEQVHKVLACFEKYFGKYPFWNDGYALVETPYLGMEHQSAIAYGNGYTRGYRGGMIPKDMNWDYIIVHETGHEYFGNSISSNDHAEMWIHESFTTYMEALYVECIYSYEDAIRYLKSQVSFIGNLEPMVAPLDVNFTKFASSDHYFKGSMVLNTLRHAIGNDDLWFDALRSFYQKHAISHVVTQDFIDFINHCTKKDYTAFFEQYLRFPQPPTFVYSIQEKEDNSLILKYKWEADAAGFNMPILVGKKGDYQRLQPTSEWQEMTIEVGRMDFEVATDLFYVRTKMEK